jgi:hypothetical protein
MLFLSCANVAAWTSKTANGRKKQTPACGNHFERDKKTAPDLPEVFVPQWADHAARALRPLALSLCRFLKLTRIGSCRTGK